MGTPPNSAPGISAHNNNSRVASAGKSSTAPTTLAPIQATPVSPGHSVPPAAHTEYQSRKARLFESWNTCQPQLRHAFYETRGPATFNCVLCEKLEPNIVQCDDCGPAAYYCQICSSKVHKACPLHLPQKWMGQFYVNADLERKLYSRCSQCDTSSKAFQWIKVIDAFGRPHDIQIEFCCCTTKPVTLIQHHLWRGSIMNPQTAVHFKLLNLSRAFLLEAHTSLSGFCSAVQFSNPQVHDVNLYRILVNECAAQYRHFVYDVEHLKDICPEFPDGTKCAMCQSTQDKLPKVLSMDGNFRLVRKKAAGSSPMPGHHEGKFFLPLPTQPTPPQFQVDEQDCSEFRAGDVIRSKYKSKKFDITGLFGSICIHDHPQYFIDMRSGESLQYAVTILRELHVPSLCAFYDNGCKLSPHIKNHEDLAALEISLAVPLFHGFAHNTRCQMTYHPHRKEGFRLADGENTERLWSIMDHFAYMTREMAPSKRQDVLAEVLLHVGKKVVSNAGKFLRRRHQNATKVLAEAEASLKSSLQDLTSSGYHADEAIVSSWKASEEFFFQLPKSKNVVWKENYAVLLQKWHNANLEKRLKAIEDKHKMSRWQFESADLHQHLELARNSRRQETLSKLHREAMERCHLLIVKKKCPWL